MIVCVITVSKQALSKKQSSPIVEETHDAHSPIGESDIDHADRISNHLIEHPVPEPGYIVLNGVKRKLSDCKNL